MPKQIIFVDMADQYPFPQDNTKLQGSKPIQVRKTLQIGQEPRLACKEKIRMLKSLGFQNLIGLESSKSEQNAIILAFQYVPYQFSSLAHTFDSERTCKIKNQLLALCESLASKSIVHDFQQKRIGLDKRHNVKYFLGVDFKIDKSLQKEKLRVKYQSFVNDCLAKITNPNQRTQILALPKGNDSESASNLFEDFEISVRNLLGLEEPTQRKIMKKSSIIESQSNNDDFKARKTSTRFTFNCDNQIRLPIDSKADQFPESDPKIGSKNSKKEDLTSRIKILKGYMKEISVKVKQNVIKRKNSENESSNQSSRTKKSQKTPYFQKFQEKINSFRESRLRKSSKDQQAFKQKDIGLVQSSHKIYPCKSLQEPEINSKNIAENSLKECKQTLCNTVKSPCNFPLAANFSKKNSLNIIEDDRQHQQYVNLANKDLYCAEFMMFLEDSQTCDQRSQRTVKKVNQNQQAYLTIQSPEEFPSRKTSNLKTQSSQNTLQIHSRVQKVIRSSLKLISGLRSRQSIRCQ